MGKIQDLIILEKDIIDNIEKSLSLSDIEKIRISSMGKKGTVSLLMRELGTMSPEDKKNYGSKLNNLKNVINNKINEKQTILEDLGIEKLVADEKVDITLPLQKNTLELGRIHPVSQVMDEISEIFSDMGFAIAEGPDIEDDYHNFSALNIPESHPARQMVDTFYLPSDDENKALVLRTHTSPVQIRTMISEKPPIRMIAPGRTYRSDSDQTHTPMFHQVEGLVIDNDANMGQLKWCLEEFCKIFFEINSINMRFRPSYFPFTEPSLEVDIGCSKVGNELKIGGNDQWLEVLGSGMVHPQVLRNVNLDPDVYKGFAFGMGIDRLAMLKYGMSDLRSFFDADLRWLKHYGFKCLDIPSLSGGLSK